MTVVDPSMLSLTVEVREILSSNFLKWPPSPGHLIDHLVGGLWTILEPLIKDYLKLRKDKDIFKSFLLLPLYQELLENRELFECLRNFIVSLFLSTTTVETRVLDALNGMGLFELAEFEILQSCTGQLMALLDVQNQLDYTKSHLRICHEWIRSCFGHNAAKIIRNETFRRNLTQTLERFANRQFLEKIAWPNLLDTIIDFPESRERIQEIRSIPRKHYLLTEPWKHLGLALKERLLQKSVPTEDILSQLVISIPILRSIDPSAFLLDAMAQEIRIFLRRHRGDLGKQVFRMIHTLAHDSETRQEWLHDSKVTWDDHSLAMLEWLDSESGNWCPDPPEASSLTEPTRRSSRFGDVFAILSNLLPDEADLVHQFGFFLVQQLFWERRDCEELRMELESFKKKFSSPLWTGLSVILDDYGSTQSFKNQVKLDKIDLILASHVYWPKMGLIPAPEPLQNHLEACTQPSYQRWKRKRRLEFFIPLDVPSTEVLVEFDNGNSATLLLTYDAYTLLDALIKRECSSEKAQLPEIIPDNERLRKALECLKEVKIVVIDKVSGSVHFNSDLNTDMDSMSESLEALPKAEVEQEDRPHHLERYFSYIVAMLTNLGRLPLERIHSMLGIFAADFKAPIGELEAFLVEKVQSGHLSQPSSGHFSIK